MSKTFYSALGVNTDADTETVQRAYRELVKDTHPDVSDNPNARQTFKRLTTARDVLTDDIERRRYDRIGHDAYVRNHVQDSAWSVDASSPDRSAGRSASGQERQRTGTTQTTATANRVWWETDRTSSSADGDAGARTGSTRSRTDGGGYASAGWQTASDVYRQSPINVDRGSDSSLRAAFEGARELGAWFLIHVVLILSALATTWFIFIASPESSIPVTVVLALILLVPLVVTLSAFHILLLLNS